MVVKEYSTSEVNLFTSFDLFMYYEVRRGDLDAAVPELVDKWWEIMDVLWMVLMDIYVSTTIVSWLFVLRPSCRGDAGRRCGYFLWNVCRYPVRPLRLPERRLNSVPANSGTPYVLFLAKLMPNFFVKFSMNLLKIGHMGYSTNAWTGVS